MQSTSSLMLALRYGGRWQTGSGAAGTTIMKELRPPSPGSTEIRLLFAFDPRPEAIFLVAGDKAGNWDGWYREMIPVADERFAQHLAELDAGEAERR